MCRSIMSYLVHSSTLTNSRAHWLDNVVQSKSLPRFSNKDLLAHVSLGNIPSVTLPPGPAADEVPCLRPRVPPDRARLTTSISPGEAKSRKDRGLVDHVEHPYPC